MSGRGGLNCEVQKFFRLIASPATVCQAAKTTPRSTQRTRRDMGASHGRAAAWPDSADATTLSSQH